jgi:hypothetical protein
LGTALTNINNYQTMLEEAKPITLNDNDAARPEFDKEADNSKTVMLEAAIGSDDEQIVKGFEVNVPMQLPTPEVCVEYVKESLEKDYIDFYSAAFSSGIGNSLSFQQFAKYDCSVSLESQPEGYLTDVGELKNQPLAGEVGNTLKLECYFKIKSQQENGAAAETETKHFSIEILPLDNKLVALEQLEAEIGRINSKSSKAVTDNTVNLPNNIADTPINWSFPDIPFDDNSYVMFSCGILLVIIMYFGLNSDIEKKIKNKREKIKRDFPDIITKFNILISCGLTAYDCIRKIVEENKKSGVSFADHPVYEELETTLREIDLGKAEIYSYEDFGLRCKIPEAMKFSSLVTQNLLRGTEDIISLLRAQSKEAWELKKADVRARGEQAGTKLVFPMMMSVIAIIVVVIYPAFTAL